uniref:Peptidase n=1 Tax=uncultured Elusimicrobia bacterium TaxID=699876 RepID=A0A650EN72_9BACT|nr:peptidase [uncultured Elusimicrobia bacterium]
MKKLFELLERAKMMAPEAGEGGDAGTAGTTPDTPDASAPAQSTLAGGAGTEESGNSPVNGLDSGSGGAQRAGMTTKTTNDGTGVPAPGPKQGEGSAPAEPGKAGENTILTQDTAGEPGGSNETTDVSDGLETPDGMEYAEGELEEFKQITAALSPKDRNAILAWQAKFDAVKSGRVADELDKEVRAFVKRQAEENKLKVLESWGKDPAVRAKREADVARAVRTFATDEFKQLMDETGLGNHPAVVATFEAVGRAFGEDRVITGRAGSEAPKDLAHRMFPQYK